MTPDEWVRVKEIFDAALEHPAGERSEFVARACSGDALIHAEVERLLVEDARASGFLNSPAWPKGAVPIRGIDPGGQPAEEAITPSVWPVLKAGEIFANRYEVRGELGRGGFGVVYSAFDRGPLQRIVALKVIRLASNQPPELTAWARRRFLEEARIAGKLSHTNVATVFDAGESVGCVYMTQELAPGRDLRKILVEAGALPPRRAIAIARQICEGLAHAHARGIVHRDIKPSNVVVDAEDRVKVTDFGIAQPPQDEDSTSSQAIAGTPDYMAPEQSAGGRVDGRADIFAVGCVVYQMLTGRRPFEGASTGDDIEKTLQPLPLELSRVRKDLPRALDRIVTRATRKNPDQRYGNVTQLEQDLVNSEQLRLPWRAVAATLALLFALGIFYFRHSRRELALTEKDTIVLADFTNTTGDPVFDRTLRQGLSAQLEQSPFLNLLSDTRVAETLALMAQPKDMQLTGERAREVCQRTASAATIEGSIASLGTQYVLGLKAVSCVTGDSLAQEQATANDKEHVLKVLGEAATKLRQRLGESLASVEKYDTPPESVTTPSLEALRAYSLGWRAFNVNGDAAAALPFFRQAISVDPNFAMAYALLAVSYRTLGETARAAENSRKAYELRGRVSERERLFIEAQYETHVTGDLEAARKVYELWAQTYPRDPTPFLHLGDTYFFRGEFDKVLAAMQEYVRLGGGRGIFYAGVVITNLALYRVDEARAAAREAQAHNLDSPVIHINLYLADFLQHDAVGMEREAAGLAGKPGWEDILLCYESDTAAYAGELIKARELTRQAVEVAERAGEEEEAAGYEAEAAVREALVGNLSLARQQARRAVALSNGRDAEAISAISLGLAGDSARAMRLADDLNRRFPKDTIAQSEYLPLIRAAGFLSGGNASREAGNAAQTLAAAAPYEKGDPSWTLNFMLYPAYLRGEAYLAAHRGAAAAAEFQKILDHPGVVLNEPIGALAHLGLGRASALEAGVSVAAIGAYAGKGRRKQGGTHRTPLQQDALAKAHAAYEAFFALWKNADPDIPILKQAKVEYAKLK